MVLIVLVFLFFVLFYSNKPQVFSANDFVFQRDFKLNMFSVHIKTVLTHKLRTVALRQLHLLQDQTVSVCDDPSCVCVYVSDFFKHNSENQYQFISKCCRSIQALSSGRHHIEWSSNFFKSNDRQISICFHNENAMCIWLYQLEVSKMIVSLLFDSWGITSLPFALQLDPSNGGLW